MAIKQYRPRVTVSIHTRHLAQKGNEGVQIDFSSEAQSDLMEVETVRDMNQSVGSFRITLTARRDSKGLTWDKKISPMDYVEIHMARETTKDPSIIMRGFVSDTKLGMTEVSGNPEFAVTITGQDYGKLLNRCILFIVRNDGGIVFASGNGGDLDDKLRAFFAAEWGIPSDGGSYVVKPKPFLDATINNILPAFIAIEASSTDNTPLLVSDCSADNFPPEFEVPLGSTTAVLGSLQGLLDAFKSKPWYEQFIVDEPDAPHIKWRLAPRVDINDKLISLMGKTPDDPDTIPLPLVEIVKYDLGRQDDNQYSYFMTIPESLAQGSAIAPRALFAQPEGLGDAGAAVWRRDLDLEFGFRPMNQTFPLLWLNNGATQTTTQGFVGSFLPDVKALNHWLDDAYGDQYLFENGSLMVMGRPEYTIGKYVKINETGQKLYIEGVTHSFTVTDKPSYTTTLELTFGRWPADHQPYPRMTPDYITAADFGKPNGPGAPGSGLGLVPIGSQGYQTVTGGGQPPSSPNVIPPLPPPGTPGGGPPSPITGAWIWPVTGPITQPFGVPELGVGSPHTGIDIGATEGTPIVAATSGTVLFSGLDPRTAADSHAGFGWMVKMDVGGGLVTLYGHMNSQPIVKVGQVVIEGQNIGYVDSTGFSTGSHLHFQVDLNGTPVNPATYLPPHG